jgi:ankyrin repeat protein
MQRIIELIKKKEEKTVIDYLENNSTNLSEMVNNRSVLHHAALHNLAQLAKYCLKKGVSVDICGKDRITPLHLACREGSIGVMRLLVDNHANVNAQDRDDYTPLHYAVIKQADTIVRELIIKGANVNLVDDYHRTPLHRSVEKNDDLITHYLIDAGVDLDVQNLSGWTALHISSYNGFGSLCHILLSHHADSNLLNDAKQKPIHWGYGLFEKIKHQHTTTEGKDHV